MNPKTLRGKLTPQRPNNRGYTDPTTAIYKSADGMEILSPGMKTSGESSSGGQGLTGEKTNITQSIPGAGLDTSNQNLWGGIPITYIMLDYKRTAIKFIRRDSVTQVPFSYPCFRGIFFNADTHRVSRIYTGGMPGFYFENYELSDSYFFVGLKFGRQAGAFPGATQTILANYYDMSVANFLDGNPANPWQQFWVLQTGDSRAMPLGGATGQRVLYCLGTNGTRDGAYWVHGGACVQIVGNTMTCDGQYL